MTSTELYVHFASKSNLRRINVIQSKALHLCLEAKHSTSNGAVQINETESRFVLRRKLLTSKHNLLVIGANHHLFYSKVNEKLPPLRVHEKFGKKSKSVAAFKKIKRILNFNIFVYVNFWKKILSLKMIKS